MSFEYYQASIRHLMFTDVLICDNYVYVYIYIYVYVRYCDCKQVHIQI